MRILSTSVWCLTIPIYTKLIEHLVALHLLKQGIANNLHEPQSSYTKSDSTETAFLKVQNYFLTGIDEKKYILLVCLDLPAAFDAIDHKTLLFRLSSRFVIRERVLDWFWHYFSDLTQAVLIGEMESELHEVLFCVHKGSILSRILFTLYTSPLTDVLHNVKYHTNSINNQF